MTMRPITHRGLEKCDGSGSRIDAHRLQLERSQREQAK